ETGVGNDDVDRLARGGIEERLGRLPRGVGQLRGRRLPPRRFCIVAKAALHFDDLVADEAVARVELAGAAVLTKRVFELSTRLEQPRLIEVGDRRVDHRALERDLVV